MAGRGESGFGGQGKGEEAAQQGAGCAELDEYLVQGRQEAGRICLTTCAPDCLHGTTPVRRHSRPVHIHIPGIRSAPMHY
jgi:hypothetical protein